MSITTLSRLTPIAKKKHVCDWCNLPIIPGNKYERQNIVYYGDMYTWKNHLECLTIAQELNMFDDADDGVTGDMFSEAVDSEYDNIMTEHHNEIYESNSFKYPSWSERLKFVLDFHSIPNAIGL